MAISGKLTKKLVENLGAGRHGDGNGDLIFDSNGDGLLNDQDALPLAA